MENQEGSIWAGAYGIPEGKLCEIRGSVHCPKIGGIGNAVFGLHEDRQGNLWLGLTTGVWRWKPRAAQFYALPAEPSGVQGIADGDDGAALITTTGGIRRLINGTSEVVFPLPASYEERLGRYFGIAMGVCGWRRSARALCTSTKAGRMCFRNRMV